MAWPGGGSASGRPARVRPGLLPMPREPARQRRTQPEVRVELRFRERLRGTSAGLAARGAGSRLAPGQERKGHVPRRLLLASPRPERVPDGAASGASDSGSMGRAIHLAGREVRVGPGLREPRRGYGGIEPASSRSDLGRRRATARSGQGRRVAAAPLRDHRPVIAPRLCRSGTGRAARPGQQRRLAARRPVLGGMAIRDAPDPAPAARASVRSRLGPARFARHEPRGTAAGLRRPLRRAVPVFHGLAPGPVRRCRPAPLAASRPLLSAAASGDGPKVHGGL